jgi:hypothetical protein
LEEIATVILLECVSRYGDYRKVAATDGGEYVGPCPWCGGTDRFHVWPYADRPRYWCRQCDRKGDAIQFLRERAGLSYRDACVRLGRAVTERLGQSTRRPIPITPAAATAPNETWQARGQGFVETCEQALWSPAGAEARAYLHARGLQDDTLQAAHVGYHASNQHEPWAAWGITTAPKRATHEADLRGLPPVPERQRVWLPRGLVFPWESSGMLWKITFRRLAPAGTPIARLGQVEGDSHFLVKGSANLLYRIDTVQANRPAMLVEAPLDALSIAQEAGDLLAVVAAGTSWGRLERWIGRLSLASSVLLGFEADDAGETAAAWWQKTLGSRAKRWRPYWDDANAMLRAGVDLRTWIREGLGLTPTWWRDVAAWPDERREAWAERAAILEVDAGFVRHEAEMTAYLIASSAATSTSMIGRKAVAAESYASAMHKIRP